MSNLLWSYNLGQGPSPQVHCVYGSEARWNVACGPTNMRSLCVIAGENPEKEAETGGG